MSRTLALLAIAVGLATGASCADAPTEPATAAFDPARLDALDRALHRCDDDADCPGGSRCAAAAHACTYDCRPDRADLGCGDGETCDPRGACVAAAVTP